MPPWGRPSGGQKGKRWKEWERQARQWEEQKRFEELDSEDDDGEGVGLGGPFAGDELHFTGADLEPRSRNRQRHDYTDSSDASDDANERFDGRSGAAMQLALRDKEELLVQKALERIRHAQMLGKTNVKLTQPEIDALERKRQKDQAKGRRSSSNLKANDRRQSSSRITNPANSTTLVAGKRKSRSSLNKYDVAGTINPGGNAPPGFIVPGPDGNPVYAPIGYYQPPALPYGSSSRPGSRSASSNSQKHQYTPPLQQSQYRSPPKRYSSVPEQHSQPSPAARTPPLPRPLPDDPSWIPRPRSASSTHSLSTDPYPYQAYSPSLPQVPHQYSQGRRNVSGPPEVQYSTTRTMVPSARPYASASDPSLLRQEYSGEGRTSEDDLEDDDDDNGVQVDVISYGQGYGVQVSPPDSGVGRQRKGRR
ncbi:hypothetical protein MMC24_000915 [Lignoscripta atroalba]|nr:hypothetical protein [Lignoscripta atroalba]